MSLNKRSEKLETIVETQHYSHAMLDSLNLSCQPACVLYYPIRPAYHRRSGSLTNMTAWMFFQRNLLLPCKRKGKQRYILIFIGSDDCTLFLFFRQVLYSKSFRLDCAEKVNDHRRHEGNWAQAYLHNTGAPTETLPYSPSKGKENGTQAICSTTMCTVCTYTYCTYKRRPTVGNHACMYYRNKHAITDHVYINTHVVEDTEILPFTVWNTLMWGPLFNLIMSSYYKIN